MLFLGFKLSTWNDIICFFPCQISELEAEANAKETEIRQVIKGRCYMYHILLNE